MPLRVPEDLPTHLAEGETVLFAGAGLSIPQLPGWRELLERMLSWASRQQISLGGDEGSISDLIGRDKLLLAAHELRERLGESTFRQFMQQVFRDRALQPGPVHRLLPDMRFAAILTTNYDKLIESAFPAGTPWHTQQDYPELAGLNRDRGFTVVKVHGDIDRLDSTVLGRRTTARSCSPTNLFASF
jgi:hypothetical protein